MCCQLSSHVSSTLSSAIITSFPVLFINLLFQNTRGDCGKDGTANAKTLNLFPDGKLKHESKKKCNLQFFTADVRGLKSLAVCLRGRGVTLATPHGAKLRAELLVVPAPLFHPKHANPHTCALYRQHMVAAAPAQTSLSSRMNP